MSIIFGREPQRTQQPTRNRYKSPFGRIGESDTPTVVTQDGQVIPMSQGASPYVDINDPAGMQNDAALAQFIEPSLEENLLKAAALEEASKSPASPYASFITAPDIASPVGDVAFSNAAQEYAGRNSRVPGYMDPSQKDIPSNLGATIDYDGTQQYFWRNRTRGFMKGDGDKNWVAKNPGNISGNKALYGSIGFLKSNSMSDPSQLVYKDERAGFRALDKQMSSNLYNKGPISKEFRQWSRYKTPEDKLAWENKIKKLRRAGVDVNTTYRKLSNKQKKAMRRVWADAEGRWLGEYY